MTPAAAAWPVTLRRVDYLPTRKESPHEDRPPHDPVASAHAPRPADSQLLAAHHRWVSALCRPVRQALPHLTRSSRRRAYPHLSTPSPPAAGLQEYLILSANPKA